MIEQFRQFGSIFRKEARGSVATIFGLSFIPIMLLTGAAVDYSRASTQWSNLQQATDATALSTAHTYLTSTSTALALQTYAQTYISGLMNGASVTGITLSATNTQVCVSTTFTVPTVFLKIANIKTVPVSTIACSQVGHTYEVALALDNSGSMQESAGGQSKLQALQAAAKQLVGILIPSGTTAPQVAISLTPFTTMVNVAGNNPATIPSFMDTGGTSSIHWQNFHRPTGSGVWTPVSKFNLFTPYTGAPIGLTNAPWGGCVEELPPPYTTTDQSPATSTDTRFVPYFAPDEPGALDNSGGYECYPNASCSSSYYFTNSYLNDNGSSTTIGACGQSTAYATADNLTTGTGSAANIYPTSGATMVCKYKGTSATQSLNSLYTSEVAATTGPNWLCNAQQLTPLTTSTTTLTNSINSMTAQGSTNLAAGFMWAWRTLSPLANAFPTFSIAAIGPQNPKAYTYGPPPNTKIIILMTDGTDTWLSNQYSPWGSDYESFGFYANNRIASYLTPTGNVPGQTTCGGTTINANNARCAMDNVVYEACYNAKRNKDVNGNSAPIIIYTIGFSIPSDPIDTQGLALLQTCATAPSSSHYFVATDSTDIQNAFQQIAASILSLRLSQ